MKIKTKAATFVTALFCGGSTWNRTRDTRIFSPLLYRLSYGTFVFCVCKYIALGDRGKVLSSDHKTLIY